MVEQVPDLMRQGLAAGEMRSNLNAAAAPSRTISDCCAPRITGTATPAPDSAAPARIVRHRSAIQSMERRLNMDAAIAAPG